MKILFLLLIPVLTFGQSPSLKLDKNDRYYFQEIIETSLNAEENYNNAMDAITYLYENPNWVVKSNDKEKIIVKGVFEVPHNYKRYNIHHTLTIDVKDNKIRITFDQLYVSGINMPEMAIETKPNIFYTKTFWNNMQTGSLKTMIAIKEHFEKHTTKEEDDW